ncbi:hypothetical protein YC2023_100948 [Brassica napus]
MATAVSGAVISGLCSSFLSGGKSSAVALGSGVTSGAARVGRKTLIVAAAAASQPKKSWIPAVKGGGNFLDPEWLDGSLPGDFGFDPLGLGKDPAFLKWYRQAELIHGRWAMAAVLGIFVGQAWSGVPWFEAGADPRAVLVRVTTRDAAASHGTAENFAKYPGDPLGLAGKTRGGVYESDREKLERLKVAEIKHSRLAMLAMLVFYFEAGQGKTPLGALGSVSSWCTGEFFLSNRRFPQVRRRQEVAEAGRLSEAKSIAESTTAQPNVADSDGFDVPPSISNEAPFNTKSPLSFRHVLSSPKERWKQRKKPER